MTNSNSIFTRRHLLLTVIPMIAALTVVAADPDSRAAESTTVLAGTVKRSPAKTESRASVNRYFDGGSAESPASDCRCNPGLYSVVYLTGENLPEIERPDSLPAIAQIEQRFEPSVLAVSVGTKVSFPNLDPYYHNVFSYSSTKRFDLGRYPKGETKVVEFDKPGLVKVFCEIHFSMRAYVHVLETPYFVVSDEQGRFTIDNVRPGDYTLHVWQENLPDIERPIQVTPDSMYVEIH